MYCFLISQTGWTWEYIDAHMDIPRLIAMNRHWRQHPPLQVMVQNYLGIKPAPEPRHTAEASVNSETDLEQFMQMFAAAGGRRG